MTGPARPRRGNGLAAFLVTLGVLLGVALVASVGYGLMVVAALGNLRDEPDPRTTEDARREALTTVEELSDELRRGPNVSAEELTWQASRKRDVEVLRVTGDHRHAAPGVELLLRVRKLGPEVAVCFRQVVDDISRDYSLTETRCPDTNPLTPELPRAPLAGVEEQLTEALAGSDVDEAAVRAAVDGLDLDPDTVRVYIERSGDAIGVGLRVVHAERDCLLARIRPGEVEVWEPPRRQLVPGELVCDATDALAGRGQRPL